MPTSFTYPHRQPGRADAANARALEVWLSKYMPVDGDFAAADHNHDATYLGIAAKAADSDLLDSHDTFYFAAADHIHTVVFPFCKPGVLTTGAGTFRLYLPFACTLIECGAALGAVPTGSDLIVDVDYDGTTVYSTQANRPTVAVSANWSGWETPDVTALAADHYLTVDIDQVGSTVAGEDLSVMVVVTRSA